MWLPGLALLAGASLVWSGGVPAIQKPAGDEPAKVAYGYLVNSKCYAAVDASLAEKGNNYLLHSMLKEAKQEKSMQFPGIADRWNKYRIADDKLYANVSIWNCNFYYRLDFSDFERGRVKTNNEKGFYLSMFAERDTLDSLHGLSSRKRYSYDYLPLSTDSNFVRLFLVCQFGYHALPAKNPGVFDIRNTIWQFSTAKYQAVWGPDPRPVNNKLKNGWLAGEWSDGETLEVAFTEPFHVYAMQDNYYFVTDSGRVFYSPPLKPGEEGLRQVKPLWTDAKQPVKHIVTDTDGETPNLTYVFGDSARPGAEKKGEKFYFKLQGTEAKASYVRQEQLQAAPNVDEPLKTLLEYGRLIRFGLPAEAKSTEAPPPPPDESSRFWAIAGAVAAGCVVVSGGAYAVYRRR